MGPASSAWTSSHPLHPLHLLLRTLPPPPPSRSTGSYPHFDFDGTEAGVAAVAAVWYIAKGPRVGRTGTALYREKSTGLSSFVDTKSGDAFWERVKELGSRHPPPDVADAFDKVDQVDFQPGRAVIYPVNVLHSGLLQDDWPECDPREGRLAVSMFWSMPKEKVREGAGGSGPGGSNNNGGGGGTGDDGDGDTVESTSGDKPQGRPMDALDATKVYGRVYPGRQQQTDVITAMTEDGLAAALAQGFATRVEERLRTLRPRKLFELLRGAAVRQHIDLLPLVAGIPGACASATDGEITGVLSDILAWCSAPAPKVNEIKMGHYFNGVTAKGFQESEPQLTKHGAEHMLNVTLELTRGKAAEGFTSIRAASLNGLATTVCSAAMRPVVECSGLRPGLDASPLAVIFAHWGSVPLLELVVGAGYRIDRAVGRDQLPLKGMQLPIVGSSAAWETAAHAAAYCVQNKVTEFLSTTPGGGGGGQRDPVHGLTANDIRYEEPSTDREQNPRTTSGTETDRGGWPDDELAKFPDTLAGVLQSPGNCDVDVVEGADVSKDPEGFVSRYILRRRPVLVRGLVFADAALKHLPTAWSRAGLLRSHGTTTWPVAKIAYAEFYLGSDGVARMPLRDFVEKHIDAGGDSAVQGMVRDGGTKVGGSKEGAGAGEGAGEAYIFTTGYKSAAGDHVTVTEGFDHVAPSFTKSRTFLQAIRRGGESPAAQWGLGGPRTGAQFHSHGGAWNALAFGRKVWALTPPASNVFSRQQSSEFVSKNLGHTDEAGASSFKGLRLCVQEAGDVLVLPDAWGHLTYNVRSSIGIAQEFDLQ